MKWKLPVLLVAAAAAAAAGGYSLYGPTTYELSGQRFAVPREWLFNDKIAWLPAPEADSFTFHLDPTRDPDEIPPHLVSVEPAARVCRSDPPSQIVKVACGRERATIPVGPPYEKVFPHPNDRFEWDYYSIAPSSLPAHAERLQVAWCSPISPNPARPKGTALCTSVWGVQGLVLSLGFEENELARLPEMRNRATRMVHSWKV